MKITAWMFYPVIFYAVAILAYFLFGSSEDLMIWLCVIGLFSFIGIFAFLLIRNGIRR